MDAASRRFEIMRLLCRRRHETVENIAAEFGVSLRTVRRDIEVLSFTEPIYTKAGRHGGVYVMDGYSIEKMYFKNSESEVMKKVLKNAEKQTECALSLDEMRVLKQIIDDYTKPPIKPCNGRINRSN